jgi:glucose-6-phosphate dehydrogenase assembly protein OpcA
VNLDVQDVVRSLANARRDAGASMKTSTMTLGVMVGNDAMAGWVRERTHAVAEKHPSRVIVFDALREEREHEVQAASTRGEWIELGAKGATPAELLSAFTMLQLKSAPVVLLWAANDICDDARFLELARHANATIFSSSLTRSDGSGLRDFSSFVNAHPQIAIQDIAYLRLAAWQELVAQFFDDPEAAQDLQSIERVDVSAGSDPEMYYVLGWLASRLGWTPGERDTFTFSSRTIAFGMHREGPPRRLSRIQLRAGDSLYAAAVHPQDEETICLTIEGPHAKPQRCAPLHSVDLASLVERAILNPGRDDVFMGSLAMASDLLERRTV